MPKPSHARGILSLLALACFGLLALRSAISPGQGDPRGRARAMHEAQRYDPVGPAPLVALAEECEPALAALVIEEVLRLAPTWPVYHFARGLLALRTGDVELAEDCFRLARRLGPNYAGLLQRMGEAWVAAAIRREDPGLLPYALPLFRDAAAMDPRLLSRTFDALDLVAGDPRRLSPLVPDEPECRLLFGRRLLDAGFGAEAAPEIRRALNGRLDDRSAALADLGRALLLSGETEAAGEAFLEALSRSHRPEELLLECYDRYLDARQAEAGLALWDRALGTCERAARINRGRHYLASGRVREAELEFGAADRLHPDQDSARYLARIDLAQDRFREAESRARRGLLTAPRDADLHYVLALALKGRGLAGEAIESLGRAAAIAPGNGTFRTLLAEWRSR